MGSHIQSDQDAAGTDGRNEECGKQRTGLACRIASRGQHALRVGLGRKHAQQQGECGAQILAGASGQQGEEVYPFWIIDSVHHVHKTAETRCLLQHQHAAGHHGHV